ncbi:chemokine CCL-C25a precursor [Silurus asotus]|uniref:Chemokine CCL-C25a n=1 Tax=Silurus asotus TaxID=30991 RepID=A0AAD5AJF8_SILAS|nr:chemokine CCL-C25a precursor [Silurus asotus]
MKMSFVFLLLGFVLIMANDSDATAQVLINPNLCCSSYFDGNIPPKLIVKVEKTGQRCVKRGFMITTTRQQLCVRKVSATGK